MNRNLEAARKSIVRSKYISVCLPKNAREQEIRLWERKEHSRMPSISVEHSISGGREGRELRERKGKLVDRG